MEKDMKSFVENVDAWIKQIRAEFNEITDVSSVVEESVGNIQHNYELIHELREEVSFLKKEMEELKLIQLVNLKLAKKM